MPTRAVVALHVAWMAVIVGLALWAGWLFRFEGGYERGFSTVYLDRWTGELVAVGFSEWRASLRAVENKPPAKPSVGRLSADEFLDQAFRDQTRSTPATLPAAAASTQAPAQAADRQAPHGFVPLAPNPDGAGAAGDSSLPSNTAPSQPPAAGAFDDLIPKK